MSTTRDIWLRPATTGIAAVLAVVALSGCNSEKGTGINSAPSSGFDGEAEEAQAVSAVCADTWPAEADAATAEEFRSKVNEYLAYGNYVRVVEVAREAVEQCPDVLPDFDAYLKQSGQNWGTARFSDNTSTGRKGSDEDRDRTEQPEQAEDSGFSVDSLSERDISLLAYFADEAGYGDGLDLYDPSQAREFALIAITICERVADGEATWSGLTADDIASGAPPSAARSFNQYLSRTFCPNLG